MPTVAEASFRNPENSTAFLVSTVGTVVVGAVATTYTIAYMPILTAVVLAGTGLLIWLGFAAFRRARVDAGPLGIRVVNPSHEEFVRWDELDSCSGGRFLTVHTSSGTTIRAWSVQNSNWSHLRDQPGYADDVADQLRRLHARHGGGGASSADDAE